MTASEQWQVRLADIQQARTRIAGRVKRTPLERNETLSRRLGTNENLKLELFQKTGSFKRRGAFNKVLGVPPDQRGRGLVARGGGNHWQALAYVAAQVGRPAPMIL